MKQITVENTDMYFLRSAVNSRIAEYEKIIAQEKAKPYSKEQSERIHSLCYWLRGYKRIEKAIQNSATLEKVEQMAITSGQPKEREQP